VNPEIRARLKGLRVADLCLLRQFIEDGCPRELRRSRRLVSLIRETRGQQRIKRCINTLKIVLRGVNLVVVQTDVGIVGKSQANAVVQGKHEFSVDDVVLQILRRKQRRCGFLLATDSQIPFHGRGVLRLRRDPAHRHTCKQ